MIPETRRVIVHTFTPLSYKPGFVIENGVRVPCMIWTKTEGERVLHHFGMADETEIAALAREFQSKALMDLLPAAAG